MALTATDRQWILDRLGELAGILEDRNHTSRAELATAVGTFGTAVAAFAESTGEQFAAHADALRTLAATDQSVVDQVNAALAKRDKDPAARMQLEVVTGDRKRTVIKDIETDEQGRITRVIERDADED